MNEYLTVSSVVMWLLMNSRSPHIRPSWVKAKVRTQKKLASQRSTKTILKNSTTLIFVIKHAYKTNDSSVRTKQALKAISLSVTVLSAVITIQASQLWHARVANHVPEKLLIAIASNVVMLFATVVIQACRSQCTERQQEFYKFLGTVSTESEII